MGRWDLLAEDMRLGLGSKLELAAHEKRGKDYAEALDPSIELPKGTALFSLPHVLQLLLL
jgi:hypothetical protein